jgi:hypothetical protein
MKRIVGLIHRVVYASLISLIGVMVCVLPNLGVDARACKAVNWPVSSIGQFIPAWAGINVVSNRGGCDFCTPTERLKGHMALAIPLYVAIFYIPSVIAWLVRHRRRNRQAALVGRASRNGT